MSDKKLISIVIPAYNEADNIEELCKQLAEMFDSVPNYDFETFIVENGSADNTWGLAKEIADKDSRFNVIKLSRNFGCDGGITAGLSYAKGDAAVIMAGDLQDPPELIPKFIEKWEEGYENIYQIVSKRADSSLLRKMNSQLFYYFANRMTGGMVPRNVSDFRLVDKKVYQTINSMQERNRFIRGLFAWAGFKSTGIEYERAARHAGESKARTLVVLNLALRGIFSHTYIPLQAIMLVGVALSTFAFLFLAYIVISAVFYGVPFSGYGTIMGTMLLMFGFLFVFLGVIGKYIGLIYEEVKMRPNFVVSDSVGTNKNLEAEEEKPCSDAA